jgi:SAM-dependent methyltransferase
LKWLSISRQRGLWWMNLIDQIHGGYVFERRVRVLSEELAPLMPQNAQALDVGCGDGLLSKLIMEKRPDVRISGIDVLIRGDTHIPVVQFDGQSIPHPPDSFDAVMFVDVLHHTLDPMILLREAARVARECIVIKDHNRDGLLAGPTLGFMDWVGNARHGVVLPYNYWPERKWTETFSSLQLKLVSKKTNIGLYPWPTSWVFGRRLHFVANLQKQARS